MRRSFLLGVCVFGLALGVTACSDLGSNEVSPSTTTTETFAGTVTPGGGQIHLFTSSNKGSITVTLKSVGDDNSRILGLALGNYSSNACQIAAANDVSIVEYAMGASVSAAGTLCLRVYDSQGIPDATNYTVQVIHP